MKQHYDRREKLANGIENMENGAIQLAKDMGLYLFFEGTRRDPIWRVYCTKSGACLGYWLPKTNKGAFGLSGEVHDLTLLQALKAAVTRKEGMGILD